MQNEHAVGVSCAMVSENKRSNPTELRLDMWNFSIEIFIAIVAVHLENFTRMIVIKRNSQDPSGPTRLSIEANQLNDSLWSGHGLSATFVPLIAVDDRLMNAHGGCKC